MRFIQEGGTSPAVSASYTSPSASGPFSGPSTGSTMSPSFGMLEPRHRFPKGHPGAEGKRWFTIRRVKKGMDVEESVSSNIKGGKSALDDQEEEENNDDRELEEGAEGSGRNVNTSTNLDHKHTLEESDRIKRNTIQRWVLKEKQKEAKEMKSMSTTKVSQQPNEAPSLLMSPSQSSSSPSPEFNTVNPFALPYLASGEASQTVRSRQTAQPSQLVFYANGFCPFAQRIWIALELKEIPYRFVEVVPRHLEDEETPNPATAAAHIWPEILAVNPEGSVPCIRQGNWAVWESGVMMEYLEDLTTGHSLLPLGNAKLRAHCRLWTDHINRKILPAFYALLLTPSTNNTHQQSTTSSSSDEQHKILVSTLQNHITQLVNASHATGPFFLGSEISFVDVAFAPWIIRLSRVLNYYRQFPRPEVGTRWQAWCDAVEGNEKVRRTVSEVGSYHAVYEGVNNDDDDDIDVDTGRNDNNDNNNIGNRGGNNDNREKKRKRNEMVEIDYATKILRLEGFGLGGDVWGKMPASTNNTTAAAAE